MHRQSPSLFVNYRSCDQPWAAVILDQVLSGRFGENAVFLDSRSMPPGTEFDKTLLVAVRRSAVLLVVVGDRWEAAVDSLGRRLIDSRQDWVRREIVAAFSAGTTVVPVLIDETPRLQVETLPSSIRRLAVCQYLRLRHRDAKQDLANLLQLTSRLIEAATPTDDLDFSA